MRWHPDKAHAHGRADGYDEGLGLTLPEMQEGPLRNRPEAMCALFTAIVFGHVSVVRALVERHLSDPNVKPVVGGRRHKMGTGLGMHGVAVHAGDLIHTAPGRRSQALLFRGPGAPARGMLSIHVRGEGGCLPLPTEPQQPEVPRARLLVARGHAAHAVRRLAAAVRRQRGGRGGDAAGALAQPRGGVGDGEVFGAWRALSPSLLLLGRAAAATPSVLPATRTNLALSQIQAGALVGIEDAEGVGASEIARARGCADTAAGRELLALLGDVGDCDVWEG